MNPLPLRNSRSRHELRAAGASVAHGFAALAQVPAKILLGLISVYQRTLSPALPVVTLGACACRFTPSCSHYAAEAVRVHGAFVGAWLALRRLVKCTPLHPGGHDPVPVRRARRPVCHTVSA